MENSATNIDTPLALSVKNILAQAAIEREDPEVWLRIFERVIHDSGSPIGINACIQVALDSAEGRPEAEKLNQLIPKALRLEALKWVQILTNSSFVDDPEYAESIPAWIDNLEVVITSYKYYSDGGEDFDADLSKFKMELI